jgi:nucleotide-binding universal stress UspA family protein
MDRDEVPFPGIEGLSMNSENACQTAPAAKLSKAAFRMKNILVPTDFSDASVIAVKHAEELAALFQASLHMVHVVPGLLPPEAASNVKVLLDDAEKHLKTFAGEAGSTWPEERLHVAYGDLLEELNAFIETRKIDLVVIGSSARSGANRLLLGSMAEYIFRGLHAPILAMGPKVGPPLGPAHPIQSILLCESLVPDAMPAMQYGCALAEQTDATVTVIHVLPESLKDSQRAPLFQRMFEDELRAGATHPELFSQANYMVTFGDTAREIVRVAKAVHADLIIMGAKPAELWQTHLGRGTAHRIVGGAHCPVLSVSSANKFFSEGEGS